MSPHIWICIGITDAFYLTLLTKYIQRALIFINQTAYLSEILDMKYFVSYYIDIKHFYFALKYSL